MPNVTISVKEEKAWLDECFSIMDKANENSKGQKWKGKICTMSKIFINTNILLYFANKQYANN